MREDGPLQRVLCELLRKAMSEEPPAAESAAERRARQLEEQARDSKIVKSTEAAARALRYSNRDGR